MRQPDIGLRPDYRTIQGASMHFDDEWGFETRAIRLQAERSQHREHSVPLFMTSSYAFSSAEEARDLFAETMPGNIYSRYSNPNTDEFATKMASLENAEEGISTASGMAAVFASIMGHVQAGDHIVSSRALFGSTVGLFNNWLPRFGIDISMVPIADVKAWRAAITPKTKLFYLETPSNPVLDLAPLKELAELAHSVGALVVVDNCFATPFTQRPIDLGINIVCHSATKYIDGQGRALGGVIVTTKALMEPIRSFCRASGPCLSPFNAWLLSKSLETLGVRMDRHCGSAQKVAEFLESHNAISWVRYPGLRSHPQFALASSQMSSGGGMIAFEVKGGVEGGVRFLNRLKMLSRSANLGDTRSIVTHPASTTHSKMTDEARRAVDITPGLIRMSVGLETLKDIVADLDQALS